MIALHALLANLAESDFRLQGRKDAGRLLMETAFEVLCRGGGMDFWEIVDIGMEMNLWDNPLEDVPKSVLHEWYVGNGSLFSMVDLVNTYSGRTDDIVGMYVDTIGRIATVPGRDFILADRDSILAGIGMHGKSEADLAPRQRSVLDICVGLGFAENGQLENSEFVRLVLMLSGPDVDSGTRERAFSAMAGMLGSYSGVRNRLSEGDAPRP